MKEAYPVKPILYDVCTRNCYMFSNEDKNLTECPNCHHPRYCKESSFRSPSTGRPTEPTAFATVTQLPIAQQLGTYFYTPYTRSLIHYC
ncbi:hypothetical protein BJV82DRAFT_516234 [Fennellomyces sp. T-0311]|nr:hypothetical protein BJV82DRAFT_516234 [Fennellomyces sp. T-0311]